MSERIVFDICKGHDRYLEAGERVRLLPEVSKHDGHGRPPVADVTAIEVRKCVCVRGE